jgi:cytochrome c-type biogenesis protein CcsB
VSTMFASLSDNFVHGATVVTALAMLGHAAAWAFTHERRSAARSAERAMRRGEGSAVEAPGSATPADVEVPLAVSAPAADDSDTGGSDVGGRGGVAVLSPPGGDAPARTDRTAMFNRIGVALTILATLLLGAGVLSRGLAAGRVPWGNLYEFAITGSFVISVAYLVTLRKLRLAFLGLPLTGFVLVILGIATTVLYLPVSGLIPALQSYWLVIHVSAAVFSTGIFTVGAVASVLQILKARYERRAVLGSGGSGYLAQLPASAAIERTAYRLHAFAFPIYTFALIAGAIWAQAAWSRYWGWDPKETWMFITWVCYAAYLHARSTAGWRGKVSWVALVSYGALLFNLIGVNFVISGLHSYTGM